MVEFPVIKNFDFFDNNVVALGVDFLLLSGHGKSVHSSSCAFADFNRGRYPEDKANSRIVYRKRNVWVRADGYEYDVGLCRVF